VLHCGGVWRRILRRVLHRQNGFLGLRVKLIVDEATGDTEKTLPPPEKNQAAVEFGRLGGRKAARPERKSLHQSNGQRLRGRQLRSDGVCAALLT